MATSTASVATVYGNVFMPRSAKPTACVLGVNPFLFPSSRQPIGQDDGKRGCKADDIGYDGHKKVKGRKRHLLVDMDGRVLKVFVSAANQNDLNGVKHVLTECKGDYPHLTKIWADEQYTGWLID